MRFDRVFNNITNAITCLRAVERNLRQENVLCPPARLGVYTQRRHLLRMGQLRGTDNTRTRSGHVRERYLLSLDLRRDLVVTNNKKEKKTDWPRVICRISRRVDERGVMTFDLFLNPPYSSGTEDYVTFCQSLQHFYFQMYYTDFRKNRKKNRKKIALALYNIHLIMYKSAVRYRSVPHTTPLEMRPNISVNS